MGSRREWDRFAFPLSDDVGLEMQKRIAFRSGQDLPFFFKTLLPGNKPKTSKVPERICSEY